MSFLPQKLAKYVFTISILTLFLFGFFGGMNFGMDGGMDGTLFHCPFADGMLICNMSPFEHIAAWQNMFTSLPGAQQDRGLLFFLLLVSCIVFAWTRYLYAPPKNLLGRFLYIRHPEYVPQGGFLEQAFSSGILNPKLF